MKVSLHTGFHTCVVYLTLGFTKITIKKTFSYSQTVSKRLFLCQNLLSLKTVDRVPVWSFQLTGHCFLTEALLLMQQMKFLSPPFYSGANRRLRYLKI